MTETYSESGAVERIEDFGTDPRAIAKRWITEIQLARKAREKWYKTCKRTLKRYEDERDEKNKATRFNILWSNVETLGPAIYAKPPQVIVQRRFRDRDPVGRKAAQILERSLMFQMEVNNLHGMIKLARFDYLLTAQGSTWVRYEPEYEDRPVPPAEGEEADGEPQAMQVVIDENTPVDYVHWSDYLCSPARVEDEITWKARRTFLTRKTLVDRFGDVGKRVRLDHTPTGMSEEESKKPENQLLLKATVWEIWDKTDRQVIFIAEHHGDEPLQVLDDPLKLKNFWPTPDPCVGTITTDSVVPIPDYHQYKDQAQELDDLTNRIAQLTDAIRVAGVYDSSWPELRRLVEEGGENRLYPVDQWAAFAEKGGIPGAVSLLPIKEMAEVLIRLYEARQQVKNDLYEITGISDIVRGMSSGATKTATEQRIKGQFANLRLADRQAEMARFARDNLAIMGEMIAEHFEPKTIYLMSGYEEWGFEEYMPPKPSDDAKAPGMGHNGGPPMPPAAPPQQPPMAGPQPMAQQGMPQPGMGGNAPAVAGPQNPGGAAAAPPMPPQGGGAPMPAGMLPQGGQPIQLPPEVVYQQKVEEARQKGREDFEKAIKLLRNDKLRGFRIDIETDSTIEPNMELEKQTRTEFLSAAASFLQQSLELGMAVPTLIPLLGKMLMFGVRGFRAGRELEASFEETLADLEQQASQPQEKKPTEDEVKAQNAEKLAQIQIQSKEKLAQIDLQKRQADQQMEDQARAREAQRQEQEGVRQQREDSLKGYIAEQEATQQAHEAAMKRQEDERQVQLQAAEDARQAQLQAAEDARQEQLRQAEFERKMVEMERKAELDAAQHQRALEKLQVECEADEHKLAMAKKAAEQKGDDQGKPVS